MRAPGGADLLALFITDDRWGHTSAPCYTLQVHVEDYWCVPRVETLVRAFLTRIIQLQDLISACRVVWRIQADTAVVLWKLQTSGTKGGSPISMCIFIIFSFRWKNWQSTWTQMIWEESILRTSAMEFLLSKVCACFLKITHFSATNVSLVAGNVMIKASTSAREQQDAFLLHTGTNSYNPLGPSWLSFFGLLGIRK